MARAATALHVRDLPPGATFDARGRLMRRGKRQTLHMPTGARLTSFTRDHFATPSGPLGAVVTFTVAPCRLSVLANASRHIHHMTRARHAKAVKELFACATCEAILGFRDTVPAVVTITRVGPRPLDPDNLAGACKHAQDGIAAALGVDDGDPRCSWQYRQRHDGPGVYAVDVVVTWRV